MSIFHLKYVRSIRVDSGTEFLQADLLISPNIFQSSLKGPGWFLLHLDRVSTVVYEYNVFEYNAPTIIKAPDLLSGFKLEANR
jgi:hypothetical protein